MCLADHNGPPVGLWILTCFVWQIFLAQSFDLMHWETLRRLVSNADMPVINQDRRTGSIVLVYEHYLSPKSQWPSAVGVRLYDNTEQLLLGKASKIYTAPNTISRLEGTPNIYTFDSTKGTLDIGFHYQNETLLRDEVGRATLTQFPEAPVWKAAPDTRYTAMMTRAGSSVQCICPIDHAQPHCACRCRCRD